MVGGRVPRYEARAIRRLRSRLCERRSREHERQRRKRHRDRRRTRHSREVSATASSVTHQGQNSPSPLRALEQKIAELGG